MQITPNWEVGNIKGKQKGNLQPERKNKKSQLKDHLAAEKHHGDDRWQGIKGKTIVSEKEIRLSYPF